MQEKRPTLDGLEQVLEMIASDPRMPNNFPDWIRGVSVQAGGKIESCVISWVMLLPTPLLPCAGCRSSNSVSGFIRSEARVQAAAVDYGPAAKLFKKVAADHGVDYKECDVGAEPTAFSDNQFDFVTYSDVMEHHSFSPKRVFREIHRALVPAGA